MTLSILTDRDRSPKVGRLFHNSANQISLKSEIVVIWDVICEFGARLPKL
jgi:hypothetical protein